jgi:hypothetical protein
MKQWISEFLARLGLREGSPAPGWRAVENQLRAERPEPVFPADLHEGIMARLAQRLSTAGRRKVGTRVYFPRLAYAVAVGLCLLTAVFWWGTRNAEHGRPNAESQELGGAGALLAMPETMSAHAVAPLAQELVLMEEDVRQVAQYLAATCEPLSAGGAEMTASGH